MVAIDTSGSIRQKQLTMFLSEVMSICEMVKLPGPLALLDYSRGR